MGHRHMLQRDMRRTEENVLDDLALLAVEVINLISDHPTGTELMREMKVYSLANTRDIDILHAVRHAREIGLIERYQNGRNEEVYKVI